MIICEGMRQYLKVSDKWLAPGIKCVISSDKSELSPLGLGSLAGKKCEIINKERSLDVDLYVGVVARVICKGESMNDYHWWVPPGLLIPISDEEWNATDPQNI